MISATRRGAFTASAISLIVTIVFACSSPSPSALVRVGTLGTIDELPLFVIQERRLDAKHGLRLETSAHVGGGRIIEAMAQGTVDFSWNVGTVPLLASTKRTMVPERVVAVAVNTFADPEHPGVGVVVAPGTTQWRELEGELIAVYAINSLGAAALRGRLAVEGVRSHRPVEIELSNLGLALASGTVGAAAMPEPFVTQSILRGDGKLLGWVIGGPPFDRMVYTVLAARTDFHRARRDTIAALLRAHFEAVEWITANRSAARTIIARRLGITDALARRIRLLRWSSDGRNDATLFGAMQQGFVTAGVLDAPVDAARVFDTTALDDVQRERRR